MATGDKLVTLDGLKAVYDKVDGDVGGLKSAVNHHVTSASAFWWDDCRRVASTYKYTTAESAAKYAALYLTAGVPSPFQKVLKGSTITVNTGYTADYALWQEYALTTKLQGKRSMTAGETVTLEYDGYLLLSVSDGVNDVTTIAEAAACAAAGLTLDLITETVQDMAADAVAFDDAMTVYHPAIDTMSKYVVWADNIVPNTGYVSGKLQPDGSITESDSYKTSVFFPIKPSTTYINRQSNTTINLYDCHGTVVKSVTPGQSGTFTTLKNVVRARYCSNGTVANWQVNEGDTLLDFTPGKLPILVSDVLEDVSPFYKGDLTTSRANLSGWYQVINTDYTTHSFGYDTKYADIIALFDALVTAGDGYVTKNSIGSGEGTDAGGNPYTIYEYTFKPRNKTHAKASRKPPKILLGGSIHGFEKNSTFALYCLMYDIVHNWQQNPALYELRNHVEIQVTPVCNPWGFDNDIRNNANDINLNRNFPSNNWQLITEGINASGVTGPLDQAEAQAIAAWMQANPDMLIYLDVHTNGHYYVSSYSAANYSKLSADNNDEYYLRLFDAMCRHIEDQTAHLPQEIQEVAPTENQFIGIINTESDAYDDDTESLTNYIPGKIKQYVSAYLKMALCFTVELFNGLKDNEETILSMYSNGTLKMGAEILGDTIIKILQEYSE